MAKTIYSYLTFLSLSIPLFSFAITDPHKKSLSFELIYRYSPRSPIYNPNLTNSQHFEKALQFSENRLIQLNNSESILMGYEITSIQPIIIYYSSLYMVFITIGTGNGTIGYHLSIDTGSSHTWTQCKPCINCYPQNAPYFDPLQSPSFIYISCSDQNPCPQGNYHCINSLCHYEIPYVDGSHTSGTLSKDTFGFRSSHGDDIKFVNGLIFGCSHSSHLVASKHGYPSGIMALGLSRESFVRQLINHGSHGRFSYCLPPIGSTSTTYLRFGDNIVQRGGAQTTPIVPAQGVNIYYIILNDISIGTKRIRFERQMFSRKPNGSGGFFVDSGTLLSRLITPAFKEVQKALRVHFQSRHLIEVDPENYGLLFKSCWLFQPGYEILMPTMTLHLQGAEMSIIPRKLFYVVRDKGLFCFAMLPSDNLSLLGAYQQVNTRFTYDLLQLRLAFNPENCEHDSN